MKRIMHTVAAIGAAFGHLGFDVLADHNDYAPAKRVGPKKERGLGAERARKRLKAKLKANESIPSGDRMTRQRRRQAERIEAKQHRITPAEFGRRKMDAIRRGAA
jgi:hypothetical protein